MFSDPFHHRHSVFWEMAYCKEPYHLSPYGLHQTHLSLFLLTSIRPTMSPLLASNKAKHRHFFFSFCIRLTIFLGRQAWHPVLPHNWLFHVFFCNVTLSLPTCSFHMGLLECSLWGWSIWEHSAVPQSSSHMERPCADALVSSLTEHPANSHVREPSWIQPDGHSPSRHLPATAWHPKQPSQPTELWEIINYCFKFCIQSIIPGEARIILTLSYLSKITNGNNIGPLWARYYPYCLTNIILFSPYKNLVREISIFNPS